MNTDTLPKPLRGSHGLINWKQAYIYFSGSSFESGTKAFPQTLEAISGAILQRGTFTRISEEKLADGRARVKLRLYVTEALVELYTPVGASIWSNYCGVQFTANQVFDVTHATCSITKVGIEVSGKECNEIETELEVEFMTKSMNITVFPLFAIGCDQNQTESILLRSVWDYQLYTDGGTDLWPYPSPHCGDSFTIADEGCDDGNQFQSDGCSPTCTLESGWNCTSSAYTKSRCDPICGDHNVVNQNDCDYRPPSDGSTDVTRTILIVCFLGGLFVIFVTILSYWRIKKHKASYQISENEIELFEILGEGKFGMVFKGRWRGTTTVAVKVLKLGNVDSSQIKEFKEEAKLYAQLRPHPNIVQFLGVTFPKIHLGNIPLTTLPSTSTRKLRDLELTSTNKSTRGQNIEASNTNSNSGTNSSSNSQVQQSKSRIRIITEFLPFGNMVNWMLSLQTPASSEQQIQLARGISAGMDHLHNNQIVHRDLAARNILISQIIKDESGGYVNGVKEVVPKICDFGLASSARSVIPVRWSAPEVLESPTLASQPADVWSFGVVLYEILTHCQEIPYPTISKNSDVLNFVLSGGTLELDRPTGDDLLPTLMKSCFIRRPTLRPKFSDLYRELNTTVDEQILSPRGGGRRMFGNGSKPSGEPSRQRRPTLDVMDSPTIDLTPIYEEPSAPKRDQSKMAPIYE